MLHNAYPTKNKIMNHVKQGKIEDQCYPKTRTNRWVIVCYNVFLPPIYLFYAGGIPDMISEKTLY